MPFRVDIESMKAGTYRMLLLGLLLVGALLASTPVWLPILFSLPGPEPYRWMELLTKLGDAILIAGVLAFVLETPLRKRLVSEFAKDISVHMIGEALQRPLRDHLRGYLEMFFVRTDWKVTYDIEKWPGTDQKPYVKLTIKSEYNIENRSSVAQKYPLSIALEETWYPAAGQSCILSLLVNGKPPPNKNLNAIHESEQIIFRGEIPLPAFDSKKKGEPDKVHVKMEMTQYFEEGAFSPFHSIAAVMDTCVTVNFPSNDFNVYLDLTFKPKKELFPNSPKISGQTTSKTWEIEEPILPGQGFVVRWNRKPKNQTSGSQV